MSFFMIRFLFQGKGHPIFKWLYIIFNLRSWAKTRCWEGELRQGVENEKSVRIICSHCAGLQLKSRTWHFIILQIAKLNFWKYNFLGAGRLLLLWYEVSTHFYVSNIRILSNIRHPVSTKGTRADIRCKDLP